MGIIQSSPKSDNNNCFPITTTIVKGRNRNKKKLNKKNKKKKMNDNVSTQMTSNHSVKSCTVVSDYNDDDDNNDATFKGLLFYPLKNQNFLSKYDGKDDSFDISISINDDRYYCSDIDEHNDEECHYQLSLIEKNCLPHYFPIIPTATKVQQSIDSLLLIGAGSSISQLRLPPPPQQQQHHQRTKKYHQQHDKATTATTMDTATATSTSTAATTNNNKHALINSKKEEYMNDFQILRWDSMLYDEQDHNTTSTIPFAINYNNNYDATIIEQQYHHPHDDELLKHLYDKRTWGMYFRINNHHSRQQRGDQQQEEQSENHDNNNYNVTTTTMCNTLNDKNQISNNVNKCSSTSSSSSSSFCHGNEQKIQRKHMLPT